MDNNQIPVPGFLETFWAAPPTDLKELALTLYQRLADYAARQQESERAAQESIAQHIRQTSRLMAQLAAERFEYERLLQRILPELERAGLSDLSRVLLVHARSWDANLRRAEIEVRGLNGELLTDELIEQIEVESAIRDPAVSAAMVRETLTPLVLHAGRIIGLAKVITSVPVPPELIVESEDKETL